MVQSSEKMIANNLLTTKSCVAAKAVTRNIFFLGEGFKEKTSSLASKFENVYKVYKYKSKKFRGGGI